MDKKRQPHACWGQWELFRAASPQAGAGTDASSTPPDNDDGDIMRRNFISCDIILMVTMKVHFT